MNNKNLWAMLLVAFMAGVLWSPVFQGIAEAYGERDGRWTASEKRQVISLLKEIRDNTGG